MPGSCSVCAHTARPAIDDALVSGRSYRDIAAEHGVTISSLSRHRKSHVSAALKAVVLERAQSGVTSALDRFEELYDDARSILQALKVDGNATKSLAAIQTLSVVVTQIAKIKGELNDRPQIAIVNVQQSEEWLVLRSLILGALAAHPDARRDVLAAIGGGS